MPIARLRLFTAKVSGSHALMISCMLPALVRIEVDHSCQRLVKRYVRLNTNSERTSHLQRIDNMYVVRPGPGSIFPRMGRGIGTDVVLLPFRRRPICIVVLQRRAVVLAVITKENAAFLQKIPIADQHVPK